MNRLRTIARPLLHLLLISFTSMCIYAPISQAAIIGTEQALYQDDRDQIQQIINRDSVKQQLADLGVNSEEIQARIDMMTDAEVAVVANKLDQLPAGQGVTGLLLTLFLVLLITDILGLTSVFPFVKHHR